MKGVGAVRETYNHPFGPTRSIDAHPQYTYIHTHTYVYICIYTCSPPQARDREDKAQRERDFAAVEPRGDEGGLPHDEALAPQAEDEAAEEHWWDLSF